MNDQNVHSYDLLQAQNLLNRLLPRSATTVREGISGNDSPKYSSLSSLNVPENSPQKESYEKVPAPTDAEEPEFSPQNFDSWESCIAWSMSVTRAEAAFVVDPQGFVIASRGRVPSQGFEGTGAELVCSIEQVERIAPDAGKIFCLDVDFDKRKIVGFVTPTENSAPYVIGLVAPEPLRSEVKIGIARQIADNLPNLD
jgi:hypothetical protein